ncbi:MAG: mechanosensitive ion channel [Gemmatimonadetes bacterium]|jgi:small conductance mechanosensitive channel|nr:mechanosensitive ion channel [Gemmatimonadota bacterium]MBT6147721.1 mechanosensitive ion channel [Gemmatimonadota bacterium]MBT7864144.1 mechanosensitive ion channel [Gemmatimonadota bacterium]
MDASVQETVTEVINHVSTWGLQVIGAIAVLVIGRWISSALRRGTVRALEKSKTDESLIPFISGLTYYLSLAVVIIAVLNLFGIETTSLVAVLGAAGLAIGFALQGTLSNFAAGVMLLVFRPFKNGDVVEAAGVKGSVAEIGIFSTTLNTPDNVRITVPNSGVYGQTISNYTAYDTRRNDLVLGISYADDIETAFGVIRQVLDADDRVLADPVPDIWVGNLGDSSVDILIRPWCKTEDYWALRFELTRKLKEQIEAAGCSIPFPQRDVHIDGGPTPA